MNDPEKSCFNCVCLLMKPAEFVQDAKCSHPAVKRAMDRKGVKTLDRDKMAKGCPFWAQYKDTVVDPLEKTVARKKKQEREAAKKQQLSFL